MNLIVDMNNAFYKSYYVYKTMYKEQDKINEKLLFNKFMVDFFYSIRLFNDKYKVDRVICCFDSKNNFRKKLDLNYKSNRVKNEDIGFYNVLDYLAKFLLKEGFIVGKIDELEADDLIGLYANHLKDEINCILSADEDLRQLLNEKTFIFNNNSDKRFYFDATSECIELRKFQVNFAKSKIIFENPHWVLFKKMILGCDADMVPKLLAGRIGEKTLKKKIFDKIKFNKNEITLKLLEQLEKTIWFRLKFKETVTAFQMFDNLSLVDLSGRFIKPKSNVEWFNFRDKAKFTYNSNYQFA